MAPSSARLRDATGAHHIRERQFAVLATILALIVVSAALVSSCSPTSHLQGARATPLSVEPVTVPYPTDGHSDPRQNFGQLYLPDGRSQGHGGLPLVVLFHGGGWTYSGGNSAGLAPLARALTRQGIAVFNVEYRRINSGGGWPTTMTDARDAADFAASLGEQFPQLAGSPVVLVGHSAGAQLAVWAALYARHAPAAVISIAGPLDLTYAAIHGDRNVIRLLGGTPDGVPQRYALADPSRGPRPTMPVVVVAGTNDRVVPVAVAHHYLDDVIGPVQPRLITVSRATHTSLVRPGRIGFNDVISVIVRTARTPWGRPAPVAPDN